MENDRLKEIRLSLELNQFEMAKKFNKTQALWSYYEKGTKPIQADVYMKLNEMGFNIEWLKTGDGEMKSDNIVKNRPGKNLIPYYEVDATAHISESFDDLTVSAPTFWLDIPQFKGCIAFKATGDSMAPRISSGDIVLTKIITNFDVILWGEIYFIVTNSEANNLRTIKRLFTGKTADTLILRSINPEYSGDTIIPKSSVVCLGIVKGCISSF